MNIKFLPFVQAIFLAISFSNSLHAAITLPSKSEEANLYQKGEEASRRKDFAEAEEHYAALWERVLKQKRALGNSQTALQDNLAKDVAARYIAILSKLEKSEPIRKIIQQVTELFPSSMIPEIYFEKAKLLCRENQSNEAYILLDAYKKSLNIKEWPIKMQSFYKALEFSLNEYYQKRLKDAEGQLKPGNHTIADETLKEISEAVEKGLFPSMKHIQ